MKQLFAVLMSLQLILFPVSHVQDAHATDTSDYTQDVEGPEKDKPKVSGDAHWESGMGSQGGYDFYVQQIIVLALGVLGSSVITQCPQGLKVPSVIAYEAGAVAYIASELFGAKSQNGKHKKDLDKLEMDESKMPKEGGEYQKKALQTSLEEEKSLLSYLKEKRDWMTAITVIWSAATGIAIGEEIYAHVSGVGTGTASCAGLAAKCTLGYAACIAKCEAVMSLGAIQAETNFYDEQPQAKLATYCASAADDIAACEAYGQTYLGLAFAGCSQMSVFASETMNKILIMAIMIAWGFALSQTSGSGDISNYGMILFSLLSLVSSAASKVVTTTMNYPIPRAIIFGVHAVLGGVVISGLNKRIDASESNVKKLEKVIENYVVTSGGGTEINESTNENNSNGNAPDTKSGNYKPAKLADGVKASKEHGCLGANGKHGTAECKNPRKITPAKWEFGGEMDTLKDVYNKGNQMADAAASTDPERVKALAADINGKAARVREINEKLKKRYNDQLRAQGKPTVDFDKRMKEKMAEIQKAFNDSAKAQGFGPATYASAYGKSALDNPAEKKNEAPKGNLGAKTEGKAKAAANPLQDLGLETTATPEPAIPEEVAATGAGIDQYETNESDVNKQKDVSIFELITNRYVLSYGKFLKRKEDAPADPPQPPKDAKK